MKLTLVVDKRTGKAYAMHQDDLAAGLGPAVVSRLSSIEHEGDAWVVRDAMRGKKLFEHPRRDVCIEWEHEYAGDLIRDHLRNSAVQA